MRLPKGLAEIKIPMAHRMFIWERIFAGNILHRIVGVDESRVPYVIVGWILSRSRILRNPRRPFGQASAVPVLSERSLNDRAQG